MMTPEQSRAARGWLGWTQAELAKRASVSLRTVQGFEKGEKAPNPPNVAAMQRAIEAAGIRLLFGQEGVAAGIIRQDVDPDLSRDLPP